MSIERFKDDMIRGLLSVAQQHAPVALERFLTRMQFRAGDISFRFTKSGKYWATIRRWPWEPRLVCVDCGITIDQEAFDQFETCSSCGFLRRDRASKAMTLDEVKNALQAGATERAAAERTMKRAPRR